MKVLGGGYKLFAFCSRFFDAMFKKKSNFKRIILIERGAQSVIVLALASIGVVLCCLLIVLCIVGVSVWLIINSTKSTSFANENTNAFPMHTINNALSSTDAFPSQLTPLTLTKICGLPEIKPSIDGYNNASKRIINGMDVVPYSWPWVVSLRILDPDTNQILNHVCGGSLV